MSKEINEAKVSSSEEVKAGSIAVTESLKVFGEIVTSVNEINSNMEEIAGATEEQAASVQEITARIHELGNLVEQTAHEAIGSVVLDQISQVITNAADSGTRISKEMNKFIV